jgi:hypothetical protein
MARVVTLDKLDPAALAALAQDEIGALRVPRFLDDQVCAEALAAGSRLFEHYDRDQYPVAAYKIGPALNEYIAANGITPKYWSEAERVNQLWSAELRHVNLHEACDALFAEAWPGPVRAARFSGRAMFWGIIREISKGTLIHWDDVTEEVRDVSIVPRPWAQLALNVFLSVPEQGGEAVVWLQRRVAGDEAYRISFGYQADVIRTSSPTCTIRPHVGDAILFNAKNYHTVLPGRSGRRISFSTFIGLCSKGMVLWS